MKASEMILWAMIIAIPSYAVGVALRYVWEESKSLFFQIVAFLGAILIAIGFYLSGN